VARQAFRNFGKFVIDFVRFPVITREEVRRRLVFHQWVELDEVMASKRGMIIVTMHYGAFVGAASLATYDYRRTPSGNFAITRWTDHPIRGAAQDERSVRQGDGGRLPRAQTRRIWRC
jgi:lauroyl/myristoyl acyltransferase